MSKDLKTDLHLNGYDPEELYFHRLTREQIEKFRNLKKRREAMSSQENREASSTEYEQENHKKAA